MVLNKEINSIMHDPGAYYDYFWQQYNDILSIIGKVKDAGIEDDLMIRIRTILAACVVDYSIARGVLASVDEDVLVSWWLASNKQKNRINGSKEKLRQYELFAIEINERCFVTG